MKLVYQYMAIFFNFPPTSNHLHPQQAENCGSNSRLVVDEDNGKFRLERLNQFYPLEVVVRGSETQIQVGENSNQIIWRVKGIKPAGVEL